MSGNLSLDNFQKNEANEIRPALNEKKIKKLPNSTAVLVLGIVSIAACLIGFITGTVALVLASNDLKSYNKNPEDYDENSYKNLTAGRTCAIIGICLSVVTILIYVLYFIFVLSIVDSFGDIMKDAIEHQQNFPIK